MRVLDLFSGIGGFSLGLERAGMTTVGFCEIEPFPRAVLKKHWPNIWCHDDVRTLTVESVQQRCGTVDLVCGGVPCQPASVAGKRQGAKDDRWLWGEFMRIVRTVRPRWVVAENVPGFLSLGDESEAVFRELEQEGYEVWPLIFPASDIGAPHERERLWIIANASCVGCRSRASRRFGSSIARESQRSFQATADAAEMLGASVEREQSNRVVSSHWRISWPEYLEAIRGMDDGVSGRVDVLAALGNSLVPQCSEAIGRAIMQVDQQTKGATDGQA